MKSGVATLETNRPLFFDCYQANRATGAFILIDPMSNATVAAGMIAERERETVEPARREWEGIEFKISRVTPAERFARSGHFPAVVWLTARRELAYLVEAKLFAAGCQVHVLAEDLESAVVAEAAELLAEAGLIAIVSSFDRDERERTRRRVGEERFVAIEPGELAASDEAAAAAVCQALERRGIVRALDRYTEGEGI